MKSTILYTVIFLLAFVLTSYFIYSYNEKYVNIFEFDFRDAAQVAIADSIAAITEEETVKVDSVAVDSSLVKWNKELTENYADAKKRLDKTEKELIARENEIKELKNKLQVTKTSKHEEWLNSTVKLYEAMETRKAGELLRTMPEVEARELIYSMKKKKAAEILSNLDTETVKRLTRAKNDI